MPATAEVEVRSVQRYGWKPSLPDPRDKIADTSELKVLAEVDPRLDMTAIYDQLQLGSCTANAVPAVIDYDLICDGHAPFYPSRLGVYYGERVLEGSPLTEDTGAYGRDGFKAAQKFGLWREKNWPYTDDIHDRHFFTNPATIGAPGMKLTKDYRAVPRSISAFKQVLSNRQTIAYGFSVFESFESGAVAKSGIVPMPGKDERMLGGHETVVVGYLKSEPHYALCRNSWGARWALKGYFLMPWTYLMSASLASDFRTIRRPVAA